MTVITVTVSNKTRCVGCRFYEWSHPDYWLTGKCTNEQAAVRRKEPRYGMDKRCNKWQAEEGKQ